MGKGKWPTWEESRRRREKAIELRLQGLSYKEIRAVLGGASMSSLSKWLRDIPLSPQHKKRRTDRQTAAALKGAATLRRNRLEKEARIKREARVEVGGLTERELFIAGVVAYAAEGSKQKPWSTKVATQFMNSDPRMIVLYLRWLDALGISRSDLTFRLCIHESADERRAIQFWSALVDVPPAEFRRTTLKRGNPRTRRRNIGDTYKGCLCVNVKRSTDLTRRIDGWFDAVVERSEHPVSSGIRTPQPSLGPIR